MAASLAAWLQLATSLSLVAVILGDLLGNLFTNIVWAAWGTTLLAFTAEALRSTRARTAVAWAQIAFFTIALATLQTVRTSILGHLCVQCAQVAAGISVIEGIARVYLG
jgi:hypothetical protein